LLNFVKKKSYDFLKGNKTMSSFTHNKVIGGQQRRIPMLERRRILIRTVREHPGWTQDELAANLKCDKSTVCRDLKAINEEFKIINSDMWILSRERVLKEIRDQKAECLRRLKLCTKAATGSRWQEEWTKLIIQEAKILGINSPSHIMVHEETVIVKEEKDAAVDAAFAQFQNDTIVIGEDGTISIPVDTTDLSKKPRLLPSPEGSQDAQA
jgi:hypothetical protein